MDEEDLREQEDAQQVSTNAGFAGFGTADDGGVRDALDDLFRPAEDTVGEQLLNRMGWKKGQGIGPRIKRKVDPTNDASEIREFPPEDSRMVEYSQKNDTKGLGFGEADVLVKLVPHQAAKVSQLKVEEADSRPGLSFMSRPKTTFKQPVRSGIGVGSLNDSGSDDEDPYEMGPKMSYNRVLGGDKKAKPAKPATSNGNPLLKAKPIFISKSKQLPSVLSTLRKCHDGKLPLTGFVLADELDSFTSLNLSDEKYKPPQVPKEWQPSHLTRLSGLSNHGSSTQQQPQSRLQNTAESRGRALGEAPLPTKSVFDYISPAARDRLVSVTGNVNLPAALNEPLPLSTSTSPSTSAQPTPPYPLLDPHTAMVALARLKKDKSPPYADDLPKQTRYKDFLRWSSDPLPAAQRVRPLRAPAHERSDHEHLAELDEFVAAAELFKPAVGFLASKFTSASSNLQEGDAVGDEEAEAGDKTPVRTPGTKARDPAEEAARMAMFGIATRSTRSWQPTRLVCKRFGVDMPVSWNED